MASISAQKSCAEGAGGGAGVVDLDAPCGPVPSSAFVIVGVASPNAPTRHRLAMIAFSFFILFLLVLSFAAMELRLWFSGQLSQQELFDKKYRCVRFVISILLLCEAVAFVLSQDVPHRNSILRRGY